MDRIFRSTIVRYAFSGGLAAGIDIGLLFALTHFFHVYYLLSATIAYLTSFIARFVLQKRFTFRVRSDEKLLQEFFHYTWLSGWSVIASIFLLKFFVTTLGIYYVLAQVFVTLLIATVSFFVYRFIIFKEKPEAAATSVQSLPQ